MFLPQISTRLTKIFAWTYSFCTVSSTRQLEARVHTVTFPSVIAKQVLTSRDKVNFASENLNFRTSIHI